MNVKVCKNSPDQCVLVRLTIRDGIVSLIIPSQSSNLSLAYKLSQSFFCNDLPESIVNLLSPKGTLKFLYTHNVIILHGNMFQCKNELWMDQSHCHNTDGSRICQCRSFDDCSSLHYLCTAELCTLTPLVQVMLIYLVPQLQKQITQS